ncbi:MAG: GNAT family N-acetyltransferase [Acidiferrobacterales bacterium]|nr:GNAT family N-acetyltransferase [Acidiferrobacterales bacterium]
MLEIDIVKAAATQMATVRTLFEAYQKDLGIELCFQGFQEELDGLPGKYAPPSGFVLLAMQGDAAVGCVAVRAIDREQAELKRLFVKPGLQGYGVGQRLFDSAMKKTEELGYQAILLDTLPQMTTAQRMYLKKGFVEIDAYVHNPIEGVQYFKYRFT